MLRGMLLMTGAMLGSVAVAAAQPSPNPYRQFAPATRNVAQMPSVITGSQAMQDHSGPAIAMSAGPVLNDVGGNREPSFANDTTPQADQSRHQVILPNGGNRPVQSVNSLGSPP